MDDYINSIDHDQEKNDDDGLTYINKKGHTVTLEIMSKNCCRPVRRVCKEYGRKKKKVRCKVIKGKKCCQSKSCSCSKLKSHFKRQAKKTLKKINRINKSGGNIGKKKKKKKKRKDKKNKSGHMKNSNLKRNVQKNKDISSLLKLIRQTKLQGKNSNPKCSSKSDLRYFFHLFK